MNASPATWKAAAAPGPPSRGGCARSRASYRYAVEEELLDHSPAAHVRRPRLDYESHAAGLDRNELGALLVAAGLGPPAEHALISLLALNGLRVSEATGADIEALGIERGHRTLVVTRKGGKVVTIPLAPRTARAIDLPIGKRCARPVFLAPDGRRLDRHGAARIVRQVARRAGITKAVGPHTLRHAFITAAQCRGAAAGRAGSRLTRGSENNGADDITDLGVIGNIERHSVCGTGIRPGEFPGPGRVTGRYHDGLAAVQDCRGERPPEAGPTTGNEPGSHVIAFPFRRALPPAVPAGPRRFTPQRCRAHRCAGRLPCSWQRQGQAGRSAGCHTGGMPGPNELGDFLRARRARLRPGNAGLPPGPGTRRTPGLRREETAALAGLSIDYYIRLEQGKETNPSGPILDGLARALRLNEEENAHLHALANHAAGRMARDSPSASRVARPGIRQLLETMRPCPRLRAHPHQRRSPPTHPATRPSPR